MISVDFESISVPENNGKENPDESFTNQYWNLLVAVLII